MNFSAKIGNFEKTDNKQGWGQILKKKQQLLR